MGPSSPLILDGAELYEYSYEYITVHHPYICDGIIYASVEHFLYAEQHDCWYRVFRVLGDRPISDGSHYSTVLE